MEWLVPIIVLIGIIMSLTGDRNTEKNNGSKTVHKMPPPPKSAFKSAPPSAAKTTITAVSATASSPKQPEPVSRQTIISDTRRNGDDFELRVKGGELKRAMVMMDILGPPKSEKYRR